MAARPAPASLYDCPVVESRPVGAYRLVSFVAREIAALAHPGQFLMVREDGPSLDPLLPRPLGIHDIDSDLVSVLIDPVGKGTHALAGCRVGETLSVLGPLGRGFDLEADGPALVVGGGIGMAPLKFLTRALVESGRDTLCLLGFKTRSQAVAAELFGDFPVEVWTEDGSVGSHGLLSIPLALRLKPSDNDNPEPEPEVFGCGPSPMLKALGNLCATADIEAQVSVASHMACGVGACQGCVVQAVGGYVKACTDGPVFRTGELAW
ncbi:MAG: dihydroorotate dehydrogenase electron transfer subunit [Thermoleophilia bacterium]